jgi:kynurenine formamidase
MLTQLVDLSHTISNGLKTYPGMPSPEIEPHMDHEASRGRYEAGTVFHIARVSMVGNTGTYLDVPFHRFPDGADLAAIPLERLAALPCTVVRVPGVAVIDEESFGGVDVEGRAVLVHTGWSDRWGTDAYFDPHPHLTRGAAELLVRAGAVLVGIDAVNVDDTSGGARPVHSTLLGGGVLVVEHLSGLDAVPADGALFYAVPLKLAGVGSFSVRAFARF